DGQQSRLVRLVPGVVKRMGLETDFFCTSIDTVTIEIAVEVFSKDGALLNDVHAGAGAASGVLPGQTVTFGTRGTAAFVEVVVISLPSVSQGSARVVATSEAVRCVVVIVDGGAAPPATLATVGSGVQPSPGALLSLSLPRFSDGQAATHSLVFPGAASRDTM